MTQPAITIRRGDAHDAAALEDLAALDSRHAPTGPVLLAEVDGNLRAAASLRDDTVIADPFVETLALRSLLLTRIAQLRGERRASRSARVRRPLLSRPA